MICVDICKKKAAHRTAFFDYLKRISDFFCHLLRKPALQEADSKGYSFHWRKNSASSCMQRRDRYMVDHASLLIAAFDGSAGGTRYTVEYAMRRGLDVVDLAIPAVE